jgi:hypothetical protein
MVNTVCHNYKKKLSLPRVHTLQKAHNLVTMVAMATGVIHPLTNTKGRCDVYPSNVIMKRWSDINYPVNYRMVYRKAVATIWICLSLLYSS